MSDAPVAKKPVSMGPRGLEIKNIDDLFRIATAVSMSPDTRPKWMDTKEKAFVVMQLGLEAGMSPVRAVWSMFLPPGGGRPEWYAEDARALVLASPKLVGGFECKVIGEGDERVAVATTQRQGDDEIRETRWGVTEAKQAGLWTKDTYRKYPEDMLINRCVARHCRRYWRDVLIGLGVSEYESADTVEVHATASSPDESGQVPDEAAAAGVIAAIGSGAQEQPTVDAEFSEPDPDTGEEPPISDDPPPPDLDPQPETPSEVPAAGPPASEPRLPPDKPNSEPEAKPTTLDQEQVKAINDALTRRSKAFPVGDPDEIYNDLVGQMLDEFGPIREVSADRHTELIKWARNAKRSEA